MARTEKNGQHPTSLRDLRVTVMGLGRHGGGVAAVRFLSQAGAHVTVTDLRDASELADSIECIAKLPIERLRLGEHDEADFRDADLIIVNPAVRPESSLVQLARQSGAIITSEIEMFLDRCLGRVIGITGTNGKSTTAAMISAILTADGRDVHLGGNIERSLLDRLDEITPNSWCVLELSSFQLHWLSDTARRPDIAVVTNCESNHLDWHDGYESYRIAKRRIVGDKSTAGEDDSAASSSLFDPSGVFGAATHNLSSAIGDLPPLHVSGQHNRLNATLAATVAQEIGCSRDAVRTGLAGFHALPHRLEHVAVVADRSFVNDSQATTPGSTIAALQALGPNCWLLAGGADKGSDLTDMARAITQNARGAGFFGELGPALHKGVQAIEPGFASKVFERLSDAFDWCVRQSLSGETVLLSPGCASLDQYRDYAARAADFRRRVEKTRSACETANSLSART